MSDGQFNANKLFLLEAPCLLCAKQVEQWCAVFRRNAIREPHQSGITILPEYPGVVSSNANPSLLFRL